MGEMMNTNKVIMYGFCLVSLVIMLTLQINLRWNFQEVSGIEQTVASVMTLVGILACAKKMMYYASVEC